MTAYRAVVSIDLASRDWRSIGAAILRENGGSPEIALAVPRMRGRPSPLDVAAWTASLAEGVNASLILLDGPQGWKGSANPDANRRYCEAAFNTPSKTGLPGVVKPSTYAAFTVFSIAVFDALDSLGWPRLPSPIAREPIGADNREGRPAVERSAAARGATVESFPYASWRGLGTSALPAKGKCTAEALRARLAHLESKHAVRLDRVPNHDELQAVVAGLGGLALARSSTIGAARLEGAPPFQESGSWREGFIVVSEMRRGDSPSLAPLARRRERPIFNA